MRVMLRASARSACPACPAYPAPPAQCAALPRNLSAQGACVACVVLWVDL